MDIFTLWWLISIINHILLKLVTENIQKVMMMMMIPLSLLWLVYRYFSFYVITLCNFVLLTCLVWQVILFRETGVVHRIPFSFSYFLFTYVLFIHFMLDIINGALYPVKRGPR